MNAIIMIRKFKNFEKDIKDEFKIFLFKLNFRFFLHLSIVLNSNTNVHAYDHLSLTKRSSKKNTVYQYPLSVSIGIPKKPFCYISDE